MTPARRRHRTPTHAGAGRPRLRWAAAGLAALAFLLTPVVSAAYAEDLDGSFELRVKVIEPRTPPPTTPAPTDEPSGEPSGPPWPTVPPGTRPGGLYVSALTTRYLPSINPAGGDIVVQFTVRSALKQSIDATAVFWATTLFGGQVGVPVTVRVQALAPNQTRSVTATVRGVGQWGLVGVHATLNPPYRVGDTVLYPITRHALVAFVPWLVTALLLPLGAGGWLLFLRLTGGLPEWPGILRWGGRR